MEQKSVLWRHQLTKDLDLQEGIAAVVKRRGALANWKELRSPPSGRAEDELSFAIQIAAGLYDHPLVKVCLNRSLEVVAASEADERWESWWRVTRHGARGRLLSTGEFARAWLSDTDLDKDQLAVASDEIARGAIEERPVWSDLPQSEYVDGVQLLITIGSLDEAEKRMRISRKFNRVERYYKWNIRLLELLQSNADDIGALASHFDDFFDEIRSPTFHVQPTEKDGDIVFGVPLLRLRLALIRWIYIERKPIAGNWRHIIGQIGY